MLRLTRGVMKNSFWDGSEYKGRETTPLGKVVFGLSGLAVLFATFSDRYLDVLGDRSTAKPIPEEARNNEALKEAMPQYDRVYSEASPAGKFALQYLTRTDIVTEVRNHETNNGSSLLGFITGTIFDDRDNIRVSIGEGCLNKTSYDINGGDVSGIITGLFAAGSVSGEVPTAAANAYVDSDDQDTLIIQSGHANSRDLKFKGLSGGSQLIPADQQTQNVLNTYGCSDNEATFGSAGDYDESSPWITP